MPEIEIMGADSAPVYPPRSLPPHREPAWWEWLWTLLHG